MNRLLKLAFIPAAIGLGLASTGANANTIVTNNTINTFQQSMPTQLSQHPVSKHKLAACYTRYSCNRNIVPIDYYSGKFRCIRHGQVMFPKSTSDAYYQHYRRGFYCVKVTPYYSGNKKCDKRIICY